MTLLLKQVFDFIKLLNSDKGTNQIAAGIVCGMILGFSPAFSIQTVVVFALVFFFRVQVGAAFTTAVFFKLVAFLLDPVFHQVGTQVLEKESLRELFTTMYHLPIIPLTRFNNSVVMGSGLVAFALAVPVFFAAKKFVSLYRDRFVARFEKTKFWKAVQATGFYKWYIKYDDLRSQFQ